MVAIISAQDEELLKTFNIKVEKDWNHPDQYQATFVKGWVNVVTTGETREQAIYRLKEILAAEILISNPKLSVESAFEQLIMCNKLGI